MAEQNERNASGSEAGREQGQQASSRSGNGSNGGRSNRGFASMDPSRQREIASKGGRAAHAKGTAHEWTADEARVAGRKGGEAVSRDRAHMAAIGREGGGARGRNARAQSQGRESQQGSQPSRGGSSGGSSNSGMR